MRRATILLSAALIVACSGGSDTNVQQAGTENDVATVRGAIESQLAKFRDAMVKGDTVGMMSVYTEDAIILSAGMPMVRGRAAINQMHAGLFSQFSVTAASLNPQDVIVTGDYAIETGTYSMTMQPKAGKAIEDVGKYVAVWQKQPDGSWKMIRDAFNSDKPSA
jgi:uncharacterized protein (TIGR02246 family)